jgi:hypothetical protein
LLTTLFSDVGLGDEIVFVFFVLSRTTEVAVRDRPCFVYFFDTVESTDDFSRISAVAFLLLWTSD